MNLLNRLTPNQKLGQAGEDQAAVFLLQSGYRILSRNFRFGKFELDIVALDSQTNELVFVEVKTRTNADFGHPTTAVDQRKQKALYQAAMAYLKESDFDNDFRFDIISVLPNRLEHFQNVTWLA